MRILRADLAEPFPSSDSFDLLVLMGGPMSVYQDDRYPWLSREFDFVSDVISAGKPVLGICLGAQILARQLGSTVAPQQTAEIGWYPVRMTASGGANPLFAGFPASFPALHWHGDMFTIPAGAHRAAESDACPNQAFVYGDRLVGLQFHLESSAESVAALIEGAYDPDVTGRYVMAAAELRAGIGRSAANRRLLDTLLDRLIRSRVEPSKE